MAKEKKTKRDLILDAAFKLFLEKGYWDTKIIDIADAAGIGKGTVYEYFDSKDNILYELFETKVAVSYSDLSYLIHKDVSCEEKIREYIEFELRNTLKFGFNKNIIMDLLMKSDVFKNGILVKSIHKLIGFKFSIMSEIIEEGIKKGEFIKVDPLLATTSIMGAINFYLSFSNNLINSVDFLPFEKIRPWNKEEFFKLVFEGIKE